MWDGECWQLLPGSTFSCRALSVLQTSAAHQVPSATAVVLAPEFDRAWACRGSGLSRILDSLVGFAYKNLRTTIGPWIGNPALYMKATLSSNLNPEGACSGFPLQPWSMFLAPHVTFPPSFSAICHTVHNRLIHSAGSEAPGISNVVYSVHVQCLARSLKKQAVRCCFLLPRLCSESWL